MSQWIQNEAGFQPLIDCPSSVEWSVGDSFDCIVQRPNGGYFGTVEVKMQNDEGEYVMHVNS